MNAPRSHSVRRLAPALLVSVVIGLFVVSALTPFGAAASSGHLATARPVTPDAAPSAPVASHGIPRPSSLPHSTLPVAPESVKGPSHGPPGSPAPTGTALVPPPPTLPSSGRGNFFTSSTIPQPVNATPLGFGPNINDTSSPSIAVSSHGVAALAYTAFTNDSPCGNSTPFATTEVGVVMSLNNGSTWSTPTYLGNPDCTQAYNYTSAWQPSVAVLANGTFAMAYIEYNSSVGRFCPECVVEEVYPYEFYYDQLVITYSYDNGTTWTMPTAMNTSANPNLAFKSWLPELPQLAAYGQTLYLLWENYTNPEFYYDASTGLNMVVSTNGGASWGLPIQFPVQPGQYFSEYWWADNNPNVLISPSGELFVAYTSNYSESSPFCQPYACSPDYWDTTNVVVAYSTNNGTTLSVRTVAHSVPWYEDEPGYTFVDTAPQLAYDPGSGNLYVAYEGGLFSTGCYTNPLFSGCYSTGAPAPWFSVSTNLGGTWSSPRAVSFALDNPYGGSYDVNYNLALGVNSTGAIFLTDQFTNTSVCGPYLYGMTCGLTSQVVLTSTDQGATFTGPYLVNADGTLQAEYWQGLTAVFTTLANNLTFVWANPTCANVTAAYNWYWAGGGGFVNLTLSQSYTGVGVTVTFNETGLPSGPDWTASLTGNARSGPAGTNLSVSGVPSGPVQLWQADPVAGAYGYSYQGNVTPASPGPITASTTIAVDYAEYVLLTISTVPSAQSGQAFACAPGSFFGDYCGNQLVNPLPGGHWELAGTAVSYNVTPEAFPQLCDYCYNYSFLSWTGTGVGSWNGTNPNGTVVLNAPVNETASFNYLGSCTGFFGPLVCTNATYNYLFQETGLPANTTWAITLGGQTASGNSTVLAFSGGSGPYNFTVWTVPENATLSWVGSPTYPSPITSLQGATETIHFALVADNSLQAGVTFGARGLPAGVTSWNLLLNGTSYGVPLTNSTFTLAGGSYTLNASDVYGPNGVGAYVTQFDVEPLTLNATPSVVLPGGLATLSGPAIITAEFAPEYFVTVTSSAGGSVTPGYVGWVHSSAGVNLTATPDTGQSFVGWTGTGAGAVTGTTATISLHPTAPVSELATFAAVVPTYTLSVSATGISASIPVTVSVGPNTYTEVAPFAVSGLVAGSYAISVPTVYPNGTFGIRYDPTSVAASLPLSGGQLDVTANGTLTVGYAVSYSLTLTPTVNGTTSPAPGTYWESGATAVTVTATPTAGHSFADWVGLGPGSNSGTSASLSLTLTGPVSETAYFSTNPYVPPAVYSLTVVETGLPAGVTWSAAVNVGVGVSAVSGATASSLTILGLNGSYTLTVPTIPGGSGVQYVPSYTASVSVTGVGAMAAVTFTTQYEVSVTSTTGGTATASAEWVVSGTAVTLTASANASSTFVSWNGTGAGAYTGTLASTTVTVTGPITETAVFVPSSSLKTVSGGSSGSGSWWLPIGLLVGLLIVGLVVGFVLGRSRPPSSGTPPTEEEVAPEADTTTVPVWNESGESRPAPDPSGNQEESIYGGGSG